MRFAIAICKDRVCQRLDCADALVVLDVHDDRTFDRRTLDLHDWHVHGRSARIEALGVDQLVYGGISSFDGAGLENSGVRLISNVSGPVGAVVDAILSDVIASGQNYWAGCEAGRPARGGVRCLIDPTQEAI